MSIVIIGDAVEAPERQPPVRNGRSRKYELAVDAQNGQTEQLGYRQHNRMNAIVEMCDYAS